MDTLSTRYNDQDVLGGTGPDDKVEVSWLKKLSLTISREI